MDCVQSYELFWLFFPSLLISFIRAIPGERRENWSRSEKDIAPCGERTLSVSAKTFCRKTFLRRFLIFYCFVGNKTFVCIKENSVIKKKKNVPMRLGKFHRLVLFFDRLRASLTQIKSNLLTLLTYIQSTFCRRELVNTHLLITKSSKRN